MDWPGGHLPRHGDLGLIYKCGCIHRLCHFVLSKGLIWMQLQGFQVPIQRIMTAEATVVGDLKAFDRTKWRNRSR